MIEESKLNKIDNLLRYIPQDIPYSDWVTIVSSVANYLEDDFQAEKILKLYLPDQKPNETHYKIAHKLKQPNIGALTNIAKQYGYSSDYKPFTSPYRAFNTKANIKPNKKESFRYGFKNDIKPIYRYNDYETEEQIAKFIYDAGLTEEEAINEIENSAAKKERIFRVCVNYQIINKNENNANMGKNWINESLTIGEMIDRILQGYSILFSKLKGDHKITEEWEFSEIFAIDIDNQEGKNNIKTKGYLSIEEALKMDITKGAAFIYTTKNHKKDWERYRIIFPLPKATNNFVFYQEIIKTFAKKYGADITATSPVTSFYGNSEAIIYNLITGEIYAK